MMKVNNPLAILFQIIMLLIYVNGVFVLDFYLFDALPRILNSFLVFFILPMIFAALMMYIGQLVFPKFGTNQVLETTNLPIFYSTILWLFILVFNYEGPKDYFKLQQYTPLHHTTLESLKTIDTDEIDYLSIDNVQPLTTQKGLYHYTTSTKSGDSYTRTHHYYLAVPLIDVNNQTKKTNCWLCLNDIKEPVYTPISKVQGLVIRDPYVMRYCKKATQKAIGNIEATEPVLFITPIENYEQFYTKQQQIAWWFLGIVNILFVGIPLYLMIRSIF